MSTKRTTCPYRQLRWAERRWETSWLLSDPVDEGLEVDSWFIWNHLSPPSSIEHTPKGFFDQSGSWKNDFWVMEKQTFPWQWGVCTDRLHGYVFQYLSMFYMNAVIKDRYQLYNYLMHVKIQCGKCVHLYEKLDLHDMHLLIWVLHLAHLWGTKNTVFLAIFALACLHGIISKLWYLTWHFCAVHFRWFRLHLYSAQSLFGND